MTNLRKRVQRFISDLHHETEHDGEAIKLITLEEVAGLHELKEKTVWHHFSALLNTRVDRELFFRVGRDYFLASRETGRVYKARSNAVAARSRKSLIYLTERGYLKMVQRFSGPRAAFIQALLVESYFRLREVARAGSLLLQEVDLLRQQVAALIEERCHFRQLTLVMAENNRDMVSLAGQMLAQRKRQIGTERSIEAALEDFPLFRRN